MDVNKSVTDRRLERMKSVLGARLSGLTPGGRYAFASQPCHDPIGRIIWSCEGPLDFK